MLCWEFVGVVDNPDMPVAIRRCTNALLRFLEEMQRVMEYGFDRLDFMYRNLERLDLEG